MFDFITYQSMKFFLIACVLYFAGSLVYYYNVKVNYTRKIVHFARFGIPMGLWQISPYAASTYTGLFSSIISIFILILFIKPIRSQFSILKRMFLSFDRPEDRPNTLLWLTLQTLLGSSILIIVILIYTKYDLIAFLLIPIFVDFIGDGLAEIIGVRFGKRKYSTFALFSQKKYYRTLEGSLCMYISTVIILLFYSSLFSQTEFIITLLIFPIIMTLTEAFSPHTLDTPFMYISGYSTLFFILLLF